MDPHIRIERAQNLWSSFQRAQAPLARSATIEPAPKRTFDSIGGLAGPKDEILTYACAATSPDVYESWGTVPPSGILLIGQPGTGKTLLAEALATQTDTSFIRLDVPRLVLDLIHASAKAGEFLQGWATTLEEMPPLTVFFNELEFSQSTAIGARRADLPIGPVMDFLLELLDRTIAEKNHLVIGSTGHPDTLRHAFIEPGRFERIVEVTPVFPHDVVAALEIQAQKAEKRAGRTLFEAVDWLAVVGSSSGPSIGDWVRVLHAVLRRKAREEAAGEEPPLVSTPDLKMEISRFEHAQTRVRASDGGNYL